MLVVLLGNAACPEPCKKAFTEFLEKFPPPAEPGPSSEALQAVVPCCRLNKAYDESVKKLYFRLSGPGHDELEAHVCAAIAAIYTKKQAKRMYGQAPKGSLEKRAQELLTQLGLDKLQ